MSRIFQRVFGSKQAKIEIQIVGTKIIIGRPDKE